MGTFSKLNRYERKNFIANVICQCGENYVKVVVKDRDPDLLHHISWGRTPQGRHYWQVIHSSLRHR